MDIIKIGLFTLIGAHLVALAGCISALIYFWG